MKPLHHELKQTYCPGSLGKLKNFTSSRLVDDKHPGALQTFILFIYAARSYTKIITTRNTSSFKKFCRPSLGYTKRCTTCHDTNMIWMTCHNKNFWLDYIFLISFGVIGITFIYTNNLTWRYNFMRKRQLSFHNRIKSKFILTTQNYWVFGLCPLSGF
jgi:hypothetical protein